MSLRVELLQRAIGARVFWIARRSANRTWARSYSTCSNDTPSWCFRKSAV